MFKGKMIDVIGDGLSRNTVLTHLNMADNVLGDEGAGIIADACHDVPGYEALERKDGGEYRGRLRILEAGQALEAEANQHTKQETET